MAIATTDTMRLIEAAKYLDIAPATVRTLIDRGVLRAYADPAYARSACRINRDDVLRLAAERERLRSEALAPLERAG